MARFDPKSYAKNVLRSAGYITVESVKGVNPTLTSYITETANSTREMYDFVKDFRRKSKDKLDDAGGGLLKEVDKHKKNILDDIRSGKFYNPEREKKALDDYMKKEGFSFDDIDFDVDENFGEDEESSSGDSIAINNLSKTQQKLTAASTDEIVRSGRANAKMTIKSTNRAFGMVNNSLAVINTSILNLHQDLAKPLNTHIINSSNFYQMATNEMAKQTSYLENINRILTERYETKKKGFGSGSNYKGYAWEDVFGGGLPNFKKWGQHAKSNFMNSSSLGFIADLMSPDMMDMVSGSGAFSSPIAQLAIMGLSSKLQSSKFGKSLNRTEDILKGGLAYTASRISARAKGRSGFANKNKYGESKIPFLDTILATLDIAPKTNKKIDHSKYYRGPLDWDGESKKALTEVIPTQLALILSALGKEAKTFNYKTGKWETPRQTSANFKKERRNAIISESSRFKSDITREYIDEYNAGLKVGQAEMNYRSKGVKNLEKDFDTVMEYLVLKDIDPASMDVEKEINYLIRNGMIDRKSGTQIIKSFSRNMGSVSTSIMNGKTSHNRFMADAAQGSFGMISNGSGLKAADMAKKGMAQNTILGLKDDKGHDIYWYLQNFYSSFKYIEDSISNQRFTGDRATKIRRSGKRNYDVPLSDEVIRMNEALARSEQNHANKLGEGRDDTDEFDEKTGTWRKSSFNKTERKEVENEKSSIFTKGVDKLNDFFSKVFFGNGISQAKEFFANGGLIKLVKDLPGTIAKAIESIRDKAVDWAKDKWNKFKESDGGKAYIGSLKDQVKGIGRSLGNTAKQYTGEVKDWFFGNMSERAARGGFVTKSGMISVSEGEMIIPSEANPFYRGRTNKSSQRAKEAMNYRNWVAGGGNVDDYWGAYRKGGKVKRKTLTDKDKKKIDELLDQGYNADQIAKRIKKNINKVREYAAGKSVESAVETGTEAVKSGFGKAVDVGKKALNSETGQKAIEQISSIASRIDNAATQYFGDGYTNAKNNAKDIGKSAMDVIKNSLPQTMASGTIGAVIGGAMTGSGLGLLGGFAIGAGIHVLKNSDTISKKLFGDENGEGGMLPPKVSNFIKKRVPGLAKSGALGTVLGAVGIAPGGLLGGLALGIGVDLLAHNDKVKTFLDNAIFGHKGADGKRRGGIIGSIQYRVIDPMANYVKEGLGKVGGYIKDAIISPLKRLFVPLTDWVKGKGTQILEGIGNAAKSTFHGLFRNIGMLFDKTIGRLLSVFGWSGDKLLKVGKNIIAAPFALMGGAGDMLNRHNIKMGYSSASATDRVKAMGKKASSYDKKLAELEESGDLAGQQKLIQGLNFYANNERGARKRLASQRNDLIDTAISSLDNGGIGDPRAEKALRNAMLRATTRDKKTGKEHTNYDAVIADIKAGNFRGLSADSGAKLAELLKNSQSSINTEEESLNNWGQAQKIALSDEMYKGLDIWKKNGELDQKKLARVRMQTQTDLRKIDPLTRKAWSESNEDEQKSIAEKIKEDEKNHPLDSQRNTLLGNIVDLVKKIAIKNNIDVDTKTSADRAKENTLIPSTQGSTDNNESQAVIGKTERAPDGILYEIMENGDRKPVLSDEQTKSILDKKKEEERQKSIADAVAGGGLLTGLAGIFGGLNKNGEKKETIFDKLKGFLGGALGAAKDFLGGIFSPITNLVGTLTGSSLGTIISEGIKGFFTGGGFKTALVGVGLGWLLKKEGENAAGSGTDSGMYEGKDPEERKKEVANMGIIQKIGLGVDSFENKLRGRDTRTYKKDDFVTEYESSRFGKQAVKNTFLSLANPKLATATAKVVNNTIGKIPIVGKTFSAVLNPAGALAKDGEELSAIAKASDKIAKVLGMALQKISGKLPEGSLKEVSEKIAKGLAEGAGVKKFASLLSKVAWFIYAAGIINNITEGFQSAKCKTILGILDEPTLSQRFLAATIHGINAAIPGIGNIVPSEVIFDVVFTVLDKIGIEFGKLREQRAEAKAFLAQWNKDHGKTYNIEEYIHNELGEYTIQEKVGKFVGEKIGGAVSKVKETAGKGFNAVKTTVGKGITGIKNFGSRAITGVKNFGSKVGTSIKTTATNIASSAKNLVKTAGEKLGKGKDYVKEAITGITTLSSRMEKVFVNKEAKMSDVVAVKPNIKEDNPLYGITNTIANGAKAAIIPGLFAKYIGIKIKNKAEEIFNNVKTKVEEIGTKIKDTVSPYIEMGKTVISDATTTVGANIEAFKSGDIVGLWTNKSTVSEDNPLGFVSTIANIATSYGLTVPTLISFVGHKAVEGVKALAETIKEEAENISAIGEAKRSHMLAGDISGLWSTDNSGAGGKEGEFISGLANFGFKIGYTIPTVVNAAGNTISGIFNKAKNSIPNVKDMVEKLWEYSHNDKDMGTFGSTLDSFKSSGDDIYGPLNNGIVSIVGGVMRPLVRIMRAINYLGDKVGGVVQGAKDTIGNAWDTATSAVSGAWNTATSAIDNVATTAKNALVGGDSGIHVSQKGSNRRFGSSTVDDNGCGPASAATVLRAYGRGGNLDDAVTWAQARGYVAGASGVGTRASYFSDILGANGIRTAYTNRQSDIRRAVGSGNPTILLGQDSRNRSKANSPFGPNPHYVVARGSDTRGNVWIDDPELGAPALYNKNILNNTKLGVLTGGGSNTIQADDGAVWNYLKSAGLTDAGVAGLMGNLYAESGIKSNKVEASSVKASSVQGHDYSRDHGFTYDSDSYTAAVDRGLKEGAKGGPDSNLSPKFGIVPEYEFTHMPWTTSKKKSDGTYFGQNGYGLVQWTTAGRKQGLYDLVKSRGVSISDKKTQLEYLLYELQNKYSGVYNTLKSTSSLTEASNKVLTDFEAPANAMSHSSTRASYGQTYYDYFTKNPPTDTSFGTTTLGEGGGGQTISFPTYNLSEQQLKGVANILQHEQSGVQGRYAEASLMANLIDMKDDSAATAQNLEAYLKKPKGWFAHGAERYNAGFNGSTSIEPTALAAATDIFNNGKRTMPRYINEHDCFADLAMVDGKSTGLTKGMDFKSRAANTPAWVKDRSAYKAGMPIKNVYGSNWKFFMFPDAKADPFGYTSDELRQKHGDAHYDIDENGNVTAPAGYSSGSSGTSTGNAAAASSGSSGGTNLASILSSTFSKVFQAIAGKLTGKAGSIFKLIIGGFGSNDSSSATTDSSGNSTTTSMLGNSNIQTSIAGDSSPQYGGKAKAFPQGKGTPQSAVEIAQSQLGVVEGPEGSNNGNITDYGKFMGMDAQPWCASFVSWVMDKTFNGDKAARNKALRGGPDAAVSTLWSNFKSANAMTNSPQPGDVIIFKNNGASHTGLVETVNGNTITSIEGNTGSSNEYNRNGGVVARHQWTLGDGSTLDKKLTGFGRPDWGTITGSGSGLPRIYDFSGGKAGTDGGVLGMANAKLHVAKQIVRQAEDRFNSKREYLNNINSTSSTTSSNNYSSTSQSQYSAPSAPVANTSAGVDSATLNTIIEYLKTIAENSKYEAFLPAIVDLISKLTNVTATINSNSTSIANQDTANSINQDLSAIMQKLETMASTL